MHREDCSRARAQEGDALHQTLVDRAFVQACVLCPSEQQISRLLRTTSLGPIQSVVKNIVTVRRPVRFAIRINEGRGNAVNECIWWQWPKSMQSESQTT